MVIWKYTTNAKIHTVRITYSLDKSQKTKDKYRSEGIQEAA